MKPNWKCVVSYKTELLTESLIHKGYREDLHRLLPELGLLRNRMIVDNDIYVDLNEVAQIHERLTSDFLALSKKTYSVIEKESEDFLLVCQKVSVGVAEKSNEELLNDFITFSNAFKSVLSMIGIPTSIDLYFEELLLKKLSNRFQNPHVELLKCFVSEKRSLTNLTHEELLKMGVKKKEGEDISFDIAQFQRKYGWMNCTLFMGEPLSLKQAEDEVLKIENPKDELGVLTLEYQKKLGEREGLLSKIGDDVELGELVTFFGETVYYRTVRLEWMNLGCLHVRPLMNEIARRMDESFGSCIYYTLDEIVLFLKDGVKVDSEKIRERLNGYAFISDDVVVNQLLTRERLMSLKTSISQPQEEKSEGATIKGTSASGGLVRGAVKIVRDRSEMDKVQDGDVLVTPLTTPDFLMAMKKSVAIVTDLGGVTSHAAITARELKKPCIIGTKIATQVLKDGDLVEVDADSGVVRVLERK